MIDFIGHLLTEFSEPLVFMVLGMFGFMTLNRTRFGRPYGKRLSETHIFEHMMVAKLFVIGGVLAGGSVVIHFAQEVDHNTAMIPISIGLTGSLLDWAQWFVHAGMMITVAHLWAEEQPRYDKRYFEPSRKDVLIHEGNGEDDG